jgi:hypothetical protein
MLLRNAAIRLLQHSAPQSSRSRARETTLRKRHNVYLRRLLCAQNIIWDTFLAYAGSLTAQYRISGLASLVPYVS